METKNYLEDITEIKQMMHRSSRFLSLSGLSGVLAGIYALVGAYLAKQEIDRNIITSSSTIDASLIEFLSLVTPRNDFYALMNTLSLIHI